MYAPWVFVGLLFAWLFCLFVLVTCVTVGFVTFEVVVCVESLFLYFDSHAF